MPTLNWIGKEAVATHHLQVPFHLLKDVPDLACGEDGDDRDLRSILHRHVRSATSRASP